MLRLKSGIDLFLLSGSLVGVFFFILFYFILFFWFKEKKGEKKGKEKETVLESVAAAIHWHFTCQREHFPPGPNAERLRSDSVRFLTFPFAMTHLKKCRRKPRTPLVTHF